jgi:Domain of unknown function (DUF4328)
MASSSRASDPRNRFSVWARGIAGSAFWGSMAALLGALALFPTIPALASLKITSDAEASKVLLAMFALLVFAFTNLWFMISVINFGYRTVKFVRERGVTTKFGAGWAIGSWFIPVGSIFLPYLVLRDVAGVGSPDADHRKRSLLWFWICWQLVNNAASIGLQQATGSDASLTYQGFVIFACALPFFAVPLMMARKLFREIDADLASLTV